MGQRKSQISQNDQFFTFQKPINLDFFGENEPSHTEVDVIIIKLKVSLNVMRPA
jgi:hypothetical protein